MGGSAKDLASYVGQHTRAPDALIVDLFAYNSSERSTGQPPPTQLCPPPPSYTAGSALGRPGEALWGIEGECIREFLNQLLGFMDIYTNIKKVHTF